MGVRRPSSFSLLGQRVSIVMRPEIDISRTHGVGATAYGLYDSDGPVVLLSTDQASERMKHTLAHESLHAMMDLGAIGIMLGTAEEEETVTRLAPILLAWMRANPRVVAWMQEIA